MVRFAILATLGLAMAIPGEIRAQTDADSVALRARVEAYQATWNTRDAAAVAGFFDADADMIMGNLPPARGRPAIEGQWRKYFQVQEPGREGTFEVTSIRFPAPGVGVVDLETTTGHRNPREGDPPVREARGTWVMARRDGAWSIIALRGFPSVRDSIALTPYVPEEPPAADAPAGIRAFVEAYRDSFNTRDPAAVTALYTDDADVIVRNLPVTRGRPAIEDWWRAFFADRPYFADPDLKMRFAIVKVRMITSDAALVDLVVGADRPASERGLPTREARATWLVVRRGAGWRLAALRVLPTEHDRIIREHDYDR